MNAFVSTQTDRANITAQPRGHYLADKRLCIWLQSRYYKFMSSSITDEPLANVAEHLVSEVSDGVVRKNWERLETSRATHKLAIKDFRFVNIAFAGITLTPKSQLTLVGVICLTLFLRKLLLKYGNVQILWLLFLDILCKNKQYKVRCFMCHRRDS